MRNYALFYMLHFLYCLLVMDGANWVETVREAVAAHVAWLGHLFENSAAATTVLVGSPFFVFCWPREASLATAAVSCLICADISAPRPVLKGEVKPAFALLLYARFPSPLSWP